MHGWMGKILQVDLTAGKMTEIATRNYAESYLGGRGIATRIYAETVPPEVKAFDPENSLIFMTGPLVATGTQAATRMSVVGKSPMTLPEGYCYGSIGGVVGAEMKRAGVDGAVITGRSTEPVYLWLHDGEAELLDASPLWGQNAYRAAERLQQTHGERAQYITTGVAGERMVRTAVLVGPRFAASSAGFGAVMGSKNLKALVMRGTGKPSLADPKKVTELNRYMLDIYSDVHPSVPQHHEIGDTPPLAQRVGKGGCYQCGIDCMRGLYRYGGRLEAYRKCQATEYYQPWQYTSEEEPLETYFKAPDMADDYSLDTWELASIINWLHACYKEGVLTERETGLPLSKIGTMEFLEKLLYAIAYREGFGDILAEGLVRIVGKVPEKARQLFTHFLAPIGWNDFNPPRSYVVNALLYPLEPRVHHNILHEIAFTHAAWKVNLAHPGATPVTGEVVHNIARTFWGSEAAGDFASYEGKALAARKIQDRTYIKESLGLCDFAWPITFSFKTPDHVGDTDLAAKFFTAVTGLPSEILGNCAERICNLQRLVMLREGRRVPEDDYPLDFNFNEPLESLPNIEGGLVPGPGDTAVDTIGNTLDRDRFAAMLKEYYRLRGWDETTGLPRTGTLKALGLDNL
jgi:aldehyde:ferredoxin oxidoreductase